MSHKVEKSGSIVGLDEQEADADPMVQFTNWYEEESRSKENHPEAMTLATATKEGIPSARIVLLKDFDEKGFTFYSNYQSRKGREIKANPHAALVFHWPKSARQVRIEGGVKKLPFEVSVKYFRSRPFDHQISALVSEQSEPISNRQELEDKFAAMKLKYEGKEVPMPIHWGGYVLTPACFEFWQWQPGRIHDRLLYTKKREDWTIQRLAP